MIGRSSGGGGPAEENDVALDLGRAFLADLRRLEELGEQATGGGDFLDVSERVGVAVGGLKVNRFGDAGFDAEGENAGGSEGDGGGRVDGFERANIDKDIRCDDEVEGIAVLT